MAQLDAGQRETLRRLQREASLSWWQPGHPGWAIWPVDSDSFMKGAQAQVEALLREAQLDVAHQAATATALAASTQPTVVPAPLPVTVGITADGLLPEADGGATGMNGVMPGPIAGLIPSPQATTVVVKGAEPGKGRGGEGGAH